ncbi:hypothetical protein B0H63DRAFT_526291 [Podospora didyma]|uniref:Uncharacterized protein n=1 Tax=Podospora didyma TaxID=330526 RepID=A0AAE0KFF7_9PEZI|nr:hypothetical protein B0H63DRAFT_526291 [Podospora didyma]
MGINQSNPTCAVNSCLNQVIGYVDSIGFAQYNACRATYGAAQVEVMTLGDLYIDDNGRRFNYRCCGRISTSVETVYETLTSYSQVLETATEYTTTSVLTTFATVTAAPAPTVNKLLGQHIRHHNLATTTSPPPVPLASNCPILEEYSLACSCIYAASDATVTETAVIPSTVEWVTETSTAIPPTSTSILVNTVTVTVPVAATTTLTSTSTGTLTTATSTTTNAATPATPSPRYLVVNNGRRANRYLTSSGGILRISLVSTTASGAQPVSIPADGASPAQLTVPGSSPLVALYAIGGDIISNMYPETGAAATANGHITTTCRSASGVVSCGAPGAGLNFVFDCGSIGLFFGSTNPAPSSCISFTFRLSS